MSLKNVKTEEKNKAVLEIVIPKETFDAAVMKVYKKQAPKITVPGFRKGKAPKAIIEKMYGKGVFYDDALNDLLPAELEEAVKEAKIEPVSQPELDLGAIDENGVSLTATYTTKPEITLSSYKGLKAEKPKKTVSADEIEAELKRVQERNSRTIEITDRAAEKDDVAIIDYEGFIGGKAFEGGKDTGHHLRLGSGQFIPGFEEQIVGHKIGDEFDVTVTFPDNYHAEELKGKEAVFKVALNGIEKVELPELDDEFAKDVSEFDTLDEYKADLKAKMEERNEKDADRQVEEALLTQLIANIEGEIPEVMYSNEVDNILQDYEARLSQQGLSMQMYLQYTGMTLPKLREEFRPQAERQVKAQLALEAIAKAEAFKATDDEIAAEYKRVAELYNLEADKAKEIISREIIEKDVLSRKAVDVLKASAKITEKKEAAPKKAAKEAGEKKPAAKKAAPKKEAAEKAPKTEKKEAAPKKAPAKKTPKKEA